MEILYHQNIEERFPDLRVSLLTAKELKIKKEAPELEKFKEEIADVFSWLVAIIGTLDDDLVEFRKLVDRYKIDKGAGIEALGCTWCIKENCSNDCLVTHSISSEITEKVSRF